MEIIQLQRKFVWKNNNEATDLPDPGEALTPNEVLELHSINNPELTTASVTGPEIINDHQVYTFTSVVGKKG